MVSTRSCANTATMPNSARPIGGRGIDMWLGQAIDVPATVVQLVDGLDGHRRHTSQPIRHTDDEGVTRPQIVEAREPLRTVADGASGDQCVLLGAGVLIAGRHPGRNQWS
jgi:hypothetical protein